jgi:5-methylthioribose kinase
MLELTPHTAAHYLRERGSIGPREAVEVRELSGGVSNTVLLVHRPDTPGGDFVLKQALPRLKVPQEWLCSIERIWREVEVLEICGQLLASGGRWLPETQPPDISFADTWITTVPTVLFSDRPNYCYAMTAAPAGHQTWKEQLLAGETDPTIAAACGTLLGRLHAGSWNNPETASRLEDRTFFDSLRLDPYYRRLAVVYPDLAEILNRLVADTYATRLCLVHGDFSPKNLLISRGQIWLIDFEVGHFGDPAFDLGFFLTHLALKAVHAGEQGDSYLQLINAFWISYQAALKKVATRDERANLSSRSALHWAACMLARVDGKSPVDYLLEELQRKTRAFARAILLRPTSGIDELLAQVRNQFQSPLSGAS